MIKGTLLALAVTSFAVTGALAAGIPGVTVSKDKSIVSVSRGSTHYTPPPAHVPGKNVIFSNVGTKYPKGLYFCCYGNTIAGSTSELGSQNWVAMGFTPAADTTTKEVDVGVGWFAGTNQVTVGLYEDNGSGAPGKKIKDKAVSGLQTGGGCCGLAVLKVAADLKAGQQYWVTVTTEGANDTFGFWNFNSTDQIDSVPIAVNTGSGWQAGGSEVPSPSFAVYGQ